MTKDHSKKSLANLKKDTQEFQNALVTNKPPSMRLKMSSKTSTTVFKLSEDFGDYGLFLWLGKQCMCSVTRYGILHKFYSLTLGKSNYLYVY